MHVGEYFEAGAAVAGHDDGFRGTKKVGEPVERALKLRLLHETMQAVYPAIDLNRGGVRGGVRGGPFCFALFCFALFFYLAPKTL